MSTQSLICAQELDDRTSSLRKRVKLAQGSPLAILAGNGLAALIGRQLANSLGRPLVPINPSLRAQEIEHILGDCQCAELLVDEEHRSEAQRALALLGRRRPRLIEIDAPPLGPGDALIYQGAGNRAGGEKGIGATIIYTSGTTGKPKGCVRSAAQEWARAQELIRTYSITPADVQLIACPLAHSAPGIFLRAAHAAGASSVIMKRFRPTEFWRRWHAHRGSFFFLVPTQYRRLLDQHGDEVPPEGLRAAIVAGAPLGPGLRERLRDWLGQSSLWQFYGSSETGTISVAPPSAGAGDGVGDLVPGVELQVRDDTGRECPSGTLGEMFVRSPTVMSGYWPGAELDCGDGFVSVGDLGYVDEHGHVHLVDRKHDTIITGGINVYPAEVEAALLTHAKVQAAVVVGIQDEDWGQRVTALVSCAQAGTEGELRDHCRECLAGYKVPKAIYFLPLEDMPVGASGKPLRRAAREYLLRAKRRGS